MTTPISNNNPGTVANNTSHPSETQRAQGGEVAASGQESQAAAPKTDEVSLSQAGAMLSRNVQSGSGTVQSAEQAAQLAEQIKSGIQADPAGALAGQTGAISESVMELLKAG